MIHNDHGEPISRPHLMWLVKFDLGIRNDRVALTTKQDVRIPSSFLTCLILLQLNILFADTVFGDNQ
jgi:hypothetical protein